MDMHVRETCNHRPCVLLTIQGIYTLTIFQELTELSQFRQKTQVLRAIDRYTNIDG